MAAASRDNQENVISDEVIGETRALAARLIEAKAEEIAFVGSTSMGLAMVAAGLPWERGDSVVCYRDDYPANVYPWMDLARRGVEVRFVEPAAVRERHGRGCRAGGGSKERGWYRWRACIFRAAGDWTLIGSAGFCGNGGYCSAWMESRVSARCERRCEYVDFAAADAHKWLLGPLGTAILYVRQGAL